MTFVYQCYEDPMCQKIRTFVVHETKNVTKPKIRKTAKTADITKIFINKN